MVEFPAHDGRLKARRAEDHPRRRGHQHQRKSVAPRTLGDDPRGQLLGAGEKALVGRPIGHGIGAVDHQHVVRRPARRRRRVAAVQKRLGRRQDDRRNQNGAKGQKQPLLDAKLAAAPFDGGQEIGHCRPGHLATLSPAPQVDENRRSGRRQPTEHGRVGKAEGKKRRREHRIHLREARKLERSKSSGRSVRART